MYLNSIRNALLPFSCDHFYTKVPQCYFMRALSTCFVIFLIPYRPVPGKGLRKDTSALYVFDREACLRDLRCRELVLALTSLGNT
jgi:hypothetical protein